jgi:hypothetical protein
MSEGQGQQLYTGQANPAQEAYEPGVLPVAQSASDQAELLGKNLSTTQENTSD